MSQNSLFALAIFALFLNINGFDIKRIADNKLANIILKSNSLIEESPQRSTYCFAKYMPMLTEITNNYEAEFEKCMGRATDAYNEVEADVLDDRNRVENNGTIICGGFESCSKSAATSYDFFECYFNVAGETISTAFNIQNVSKERMEYIQFRYNNITFDKNRCTDECSRIYIEETTRTYSELEACLNGVTVGPTSPTTAAPTNAPTAAPTIAPTDAPTDSY